MEDLALRISQDRICQLDVHEFVHCFEDSIVGLAAFHFDHDLRVFGHLEQMQGKLRDEGGTIFLGFRSSYSAMSIIRANERVGNDK